MIVFREQTRVELTVNKPETSVNYIVCLPGFGEMSIVAQVLVVQGFPSNMAEKLRRPYKRNHTRNEG